MSLGAILRAVTAIDAIMRIVRGWRKPRITEADKMPSGNFVDSDIGGYMNQRIDITEMIKSDEGTGPRRGDRLLMYKCSADKWTIGYGRNIEDNGITVDEANYLLSCDIRRTTDEAERSFDWFRNLSHNRQCVVINMLFNMGLSRFRGFKNMIAAIEKGDYPSASEHMIDSLWARQVGKRAVDLAYIMLHDRRI